MALGVLGGADMVSIVIRQSLVQLSTPDAMRGRVSAVQLDVHRRPRTSSASSSRALTAALLGAVPAVLVGGIGTIVVVALWMYRFPELRRFELAGP